MLGLLAIGSPLHFQTSREFYLFTLGPCETVRDFDGFAESDLRRECRLVQCGKTKTCESVY